MPILINKVRIYNYRSLRKCTIELTPVTLLIGEKQFGELINIDPGDKEYFSFCTKIFYNLLKGDYTIKRYKIKDWQDIENWEAIEYNEELKPYLDGFPLFFIDAQRDIISDLRDKSSYFGRMVSKIKIDEALIKEIEEKIREINEGIV